MKNLFLTLFAFFMLTVALQAQPEVFFGGLVGANKASFKFNKFEDEYLKFTAVGFKYSSTSKINGFDGGIRAGINLGSRLSIIGELIYAKHNASYQTDLTPEIVRTGNLQYQNCSSGRRSWDIGMTGLTIPVYARVKLFGNDKFGLFVTGGLSFRKLFSKGTYATSYKPDGTTGITVESLNNQIFPVYAINNPSQTGYIYYSAQFPANAETEELTFGANKENNYAAFSTNLMLGSTLRYVVDDDGKFALTFDLNWNKSLTNMFSQERIGYLSSLDPTAARQYKDIDNITQTWLYPPQRFDIVGSQKMNTTLFSIGFEFCPSCGGW
jgi:hypothetical protein